MRIHCSAERVRFADSTLRKEREGWGTRRSVTGMEPKNLFLGNLLVSSSEL
jgi:hypothetical protein